MNQLVEDLRVAERSTVSGRGSGAMLRRLVNRLVHEPLVHFLLIGSVLFAAVHHWQERARDDRIILTSGEIGRLSEQYRLQYGSDPTAQQVKALIERWINQEVFYREALKLGLEQDDEIIRRRLVQKYEFLQQDLWVPTQPSERELQDFYRDHLGRYRAPRTVTFTHVYFSSDRVGEAQAREQAREAAAELSRLGLTRAPQQGNVFPGNDNLIAASEDELARVFGREGLSAAIFGIEPNRWSEPLRSAFGWHTVYVTVREPERPLPFAEVREAVQRHYLEAQGDLRRKEALSTLRGRYEIVRK